MNITRKDIFFRDEDGLEEAISKAEFDAIVGPKFAQHFDFENFKIEIRYMEEEEVCKIAGFRGAIKVSYSLGNLYFFDGYAIERCESIRSGNGGSWKVCNMPRGKGYAASFEACKEIVKKEGSAK